MQQEMSTHYLKTTSLQTNFGIHISVYIWQVELEKKHWKAQNNIEN